MSYFTYHIQKNTQVSSDEQELHDLLEKIQSGMATMAQAQSTFKVESMATENAALAALQGEALQARRLIRRAELKLDWFQNIILAYAFTETWDAAGAQEFWDGAVAGAKTPQARIRALTARAEFYYVRGLNDDWENARADFEAALAELRGDQDSQGPDPVAQQTAFMQLHQAMFEFNIGNDEMAIGLAADAFVRANSISTTWRKLTTLDRLGAIAQAMQNQVIPPREVLTEAGAELSRRGDLGALPAKTAALFSMPADGAQLTGLYGESS